MQVLKEYYSVGLILKKAKMAFSNSRLLVLTTYNPREHYSVDFFFQSFSKNPGVESPWPYLGPIIILEPIVPVARRRCVLIIQVWAVCISRELGSKVNPR